MMLPPFRIRNLWRSNSTTDTNTHSRVSTELGTPDHHGVVQVWAPEYDAIISTHPEATLKYMDEDDGEVITVGSSLELAQRLEEPITTTSRTSTKSPPFLYPAMPRPANPCLSTISPQLHIFDIDRTSVAPSLWRNIERRQQDDFSTVPSTSPYRSRPLLVDLPKQGLQKGPIGSPTSNAKVALTEGQREHYFKVTEPPQLSRERESEAVPPTHSTLISFEPSCEDSSRKLNPLLKGYGFELAELTKEWGCLSSEGRKQAEEAGLKLGCSIKRPMSHSPPEIPQKKAHQERWAAYSRINTDPQLQDGKTPTEVKSHSADGLSQAHRPLLEVFEAELAKVLSDECVPSAVETTETLAPHPKPASEYLAPDTTSDPRGSEISSGIQDSPVEVFGQAVREFIDGIGLLTSEIRSNIPDAHEQLLNAQQKLPHVVQQTLSGALRGWGSHVHRFANNVQLASIRTRSAADRTRGFDTQLLEGVISGLYGLAVGVGEIGGALFPGMTLESTTDPSEGQAENNPGSTTAGADLTTPLPEPAHPVDVTVEDEAQPVDVASTVTSKRLTEDCTQPSLASTEASSTLDGSLAYARRKDVHGEYEKIHRYKREEAADRREADRQRLRRMQQEADEASQQSDTSARLNGRERQIDGADQITSAQEQKQYDQFKKVRAADKESYHPKPYCLFGCTSSSSCRHRRAPGGSPYPSRVDSFRNRLTRRSPLSYTSQLPYEYVVPPPDFYDTSKSDSTSNPFRHNRGRFHVRSRLPATSSRESSQDKSTASCDWPKVQRYGPIHLPHNACRPSDDTWTSQLPYSRSPRSLSPPGRWTDARSTAPRVPSPELAWADASSQSPRQPRPDMHRVDTRSQTPRQPPPETHWVNERVATTSAAFCPSGSQCGLIPANPAEGLASSHKDVGHHTGTLRHRQSWHPSSATKTPERWNMTFPERPAVSFVEPDGVSPLPSWNRVLQHRRSTGLFTSPKVPYSTTPDLSGPVSGAQTKATQANIQTKLAYPAYPWYYSPHDENMEKRTAQGELGNEKLWRGVGRDPYEFIGPRPSVNSPWNNTPESLQPSPVKDSNLPVRAATVRNSTPKGELGISSELPSLSSVLESPSTEKTVPELKRFPTLAQFESETSKTLPPFPPLPTMEPLIPVRTDAKLKGAAGPKDADKTANKADVSKSQNSLKNVLTQTDAPQMNESSGQFFRRMTGLGTSSLARSDEMAHAAVGSLWPLAHGADIKDRTTQNPRRYKCPFCDKAFRRLDNHWTHLSTHSKLGKPHGSQIPDDTQDLFLNMASDTSYQAGQNSLDSISPNNALESLTEGQPTRPTTLKPEQGESRLTRPFDPLAESVTLHRSRLIDNFRRTTAQRRSFHDYYAGNRRPYSEYFTGNGRLGWESFLAKHEGASSRLPTPTDHPAPSVAIEKSVVPETSESMPRSEAPMYNAGEHHDVKTVEKVQECVDQLRSLGFGTSENGGEARLLVYAQAAEGNLEDAIETIEEERKAYKQRVEL